MEEKEPVEDNDDNNDIVNITVMQFFGIPGEAFLGKDTENKKKK